MLSIVIQLFFIINIEIDTYFYVIDIYICMYIAYSKNLASLHIVIDINRSL